MGRLTNQVVLITGCSSGIGRALAEEFRGQKHRVFASARRPESLVELDQAGFETVRLEVNDEASINAAVAAVLERAGRIDMIVNNAGYGLIAPSAELSSDELRRQLDTNVVGPLALVRAVVPHMVARRAGRIVNVGSVSGILASPFAGAYCASKAALHMLSDTLRMELAPFGIDVITVQPGAIRSRFGNVAEESAERFGGEGSLYASISPFMKKRAQTSQENATDAGDFARAVVRAVTAVPAPPIVRLGSGARRYVLLKHLVPTRLSDRIMAGKFGLDRLSR